MVRMKRVERDGRFTFTVSNAQIDYEIYAELDDLVPGQVLVSGSQKTPEVTIELKLSTKQENR
jgi:hypothetical protein